MVLFIPLGVGAMRTSLIQLNPNLEESARGLGKNTLQVFLSITLPLIKPGIIAASAMVFLLCMKELPVTLILSPIGFTTLATTIWSTAEEAFFAQAAISSLVLIIVSSIPMLFLIRNRGYRPL
jgi:iron(III) transport system permease protein